MRKYGIGFFSALMLLASSYAYSAAYNQQNTQQGQNNNRNPGAISQNDAPNLYDRNSQSLRSSGGSSTNTNSSNKAGYRSSYYYQDKFYRYNSNPNDVNADYNAVTPNYYDANSPTYNWDNVNNPYRGDYQGGYDYRNPY